MNSVAANILINAQAAQAVAVLNRVQGQLRALQVAGTTARTSSNGPWFTGLASSGGVLGRTQAQLKALQAQTASANATSNRPWFASMTAAGSRMQWIGRQLTSNFTLPILAATAAGVKWGLDFEKSMTRVNKVYGDGSMPAKQHTNEVNALRKAMIALSDTYGVQADEVANVAADWAAAGSSGKALAEQTDLTMRTMVLGEMDAAEATKSLIAIQSQWGAVTKDNAEGHLSLETILRQLNAVENETGTSMNDLVVAFSRASGTARTAGLDTAHLAAMVAALVPAAGSASEAGTALKSMMSKLFTPTKEASEILGMMGINMSDAAYQSLNGAQRMELLAGKFEGLTQAQKQQVSASIATRWQINKFEVLMDSLNNKMGYYHKSLALLADKDRVAAIAQQELNKVLESSPQRAKQAGVIIQNSLMKAMEPLIPTIIQLALWFGKLFRAFSEISPSIRTTIVAFLLLLSALGPMIIAAGLLRLSIGQLAPMFIFLGKALLIPLLPLKLLQLSFLKSIVTSRLITGAFIAMLGGMRIIAGLMMGVGYITAAAFMVMATGARAASTAVVAAWRLAWAALVVMQTVTGVMLTTRQAATFLVLFTLQRLWHSASLAAHAAWSTASVAIQRGWSILMLAVQTAWYAASVLVMGTWRASMLALQGSYNAASRVLHYSWAAASIAIQKAWSIASLLLSAKTWKGMTLLAAGGMKGIIKMIAAGGSAILGVLTSPWTIAIGVVVGLIVIFRKQIAKAFSNIVNYFRNLPNDVASGLSPIANVFAKIKGVILNAFNALPSGVKNALLAVVRIVRAAALKVYELFSYINPFAHHSPSLVENVTNGMAAVNSQFANSAASAESNIARMHKAVNSLKGLGKDLEVRNQRAEDQELASNANKAGSGGAVPAYFAVRKEVEAGKAQMEALNKEIERNQAVVDAASAAVDRQQKKLDAISRASERYDKILEQLNKELDTTKQIQDMVGQALDSAKARFDRFSNAQIKGTQAAEDAIFSNTQAQKRLQLQIAKMEQESGTVDSVTDSYSKLQGEIETLTAKQTELRKAGAGSDILGTYDKMIADLKSQQGALLDGSADSPAAKIAALNTQLEKLQKQADIMDLEKSLKFDGLNRNLDKLKSNIEEMPYGEIANGLDSSKISVDAMQRSYDQLNTVMDGQNARIQAVQNSKDQLQAVYDLENDKLTTLKDNYDLQNDRLDKLKDAYSKIEESVRSGEEAMQNFSSAVDTAIQKQEELANAKKGSGGKGGGGGGDGELSPGAQNFQDAAIGDFETFGGDATLGREGGPGDQSGDIDAFTKSLTDGLETSLGGLNPFAPLMKAWDKTKEWFSQNITPLGAPITQMFSGIGQGIGQAFGEEQDGKVSKFASAIKGVADVFKWFWDALKTIGSLIGGLFGPDLLTTVSELGKGFADIWGQIVEPLKDLGNEVVQFLKPAFEIIAPVIGAVVLVLEVLWEVINGAIGPVFNWLGGIIRAVIQIITGVIRIITGALNIIVGVVKLIIGVFKGIFTGDWGTAIDGLKQIFVDGFGKMAKGIWNIVQGIWTAIWSTIKNFAKLIWNVIWGFVKGIIDFFTHLWDVLVGHSIVPDMINAIIEWFKKLPGQLLGMILGFITMVIGFFLTLPAKILGVFLSLGGMLLQAIANAIDWLAANGPAILMRVVEFFVRLPLWIIQGLGKLADLLMGWISDAVQFLLGWLPSGVQGIITFFLQLPFMLISALGDLAGKLGDWIGGAFNWLVDNMAPLLAKFWGWLTAFPSNFIRGLGIIAEKLGAWFQAGWDYLVDNAGQILGNFWGWLASLPGAILGKLGDASKMLFNYGKDMIQGLLNGAEGLLKKVGDWFLDKLPGWIKEPFKKALGIASPSKVFQGYGENIGQGLVNGIDGMQKDVEKSSIAIAAAADKGQVGGMAISAVADTSSVGGTVSQLQAAVPSTAITAAVSTAPTDETVADPMADIDLDAAMAEIETFVDTATAKFQAFSGAVGASFTQINTVAQATFGNLSTIAVSTFTQMQTNVVSIVTTMVNTVAGQLQLLVTYVVAFGQDFTAAWNAAWELVNGSTTTGVDHTLTEWQRMADTLRSTLDDSIRPVFDDMKTMLTELEESFTTTVDNIGTTWANVETNTKKPAGVVVNEVYNKGLRGAWNKFNDFLGIEALPEFTVPYKTGGAVWGPGNGTSDSVNARLSRGEHVITAKEVQGAGGHKAVMAQRKMWAAGGGRMMDTLGTSRGYGSRVGPGFASGGSVQLGNISGEGITTPIQQAMWDAVRTAFPNATLNSATRTVQTEGHADYHNAGMALDLGGPMDEIARWIYQMNSKTPVLELIHWPLNGWQNLKNGSPLDYGAGTNAGHQDHVHWAMNVMVGNDGKIISMAGGSSGAAAIDYSRLIEETFKQDMDDIRGKLPNIKGGIGQWPKIAADVSQKKAVDFLKPLAKKLSISSGSLASPWAGAPDASVVQKVKAAMKPYGWDEGAEWEALNQLIGHESSWNPTAQNPSSTAYGLFQFLDTTWATVGGAKTDDPYQQAVYGARYIKNKYQTPSGAWAFWQNPQPNPYGGNWYDAGGYLQPGSQVVHNQTGGPEPVLTQAQWNAMFTLAGNVNTLSPEDVQDAVEQANINTGNTDDATTTAIIKGMDTWSEGWTPAIVDSAEAATDASNAVASAATAQTGATVLLSKSLGKYDTQIAALSKALTAFSNSAQQSVKVTVNVKNGNTTTTGDTSVNKNGKGETEITVEQPSFAAWAPTMNAVADLLDALPYAERDWQADNPVAGETEQQRKARIAQNNLVNYTKGSWNVLKDVGGPMLRHTAIIGTAAEKLIQEDGPAWSAALAAIAANNPAGYAVAVLLVLKEVATILPLILNAILDIVPALIRAIVRFLTQFMPDSVYAYADMASAEAAVTEQQEGGSTAMGQGQRYPTDAVSSNSANENINLYMYGDLVMPNVSDGSDASDFVDQLRLLASS